MALPTRKILVLHTAFCSLLSQGPIRGSAAIKNACFFGGSFRSRFPISFKDSEDALGFLTKFTYRRFAGIASRFIVFA